MDSNKNKKFGFKKGTALLMTILILNSILLVSLVASKLMTAGIKMSGTQAMSAKAYFAAEAGAERVLWEFRKNSLFPDGLPSGEWPIFSETELANNSFYEVNYARFNTVKFFSLGSFAGVKRSVELEFKIYQ